MKRDWDLIREVLLAVEANSSRELHFDVGEDDERKTAEHAFLLWKSGFLDGVNASSMDGDYVIVTGLTWAGHDLLQTIQSKPVWERIKSTAQEKSIDLTFDAVKKLGAMALDAILAS